MIKDAASLVVVSSADFEAEERFELPGGTFRIGSGLHNDLVLEGEGVARSHVSIVEEGGRWRVESELGVKLDGNVVQAGALANGSELQIGGHHFRFFARGAAGDRPRPRAAAKSEPWDTWRAESDGTRFLATARFDTGEGQYSETDIPRRYEALRRAFRAVDALMHVVELDELSRRVVEAAVELAAPETARLLLSASTGGFEERETYSTLPRGEALPPVSRTVIDHVVEHLETVLALDAQSDDRWQDAASVQDSGVRSLICVPLLREKRVYGVLYLTDTRRSAAFTQTDLELLSAIGAGAGLALANAHLYSEIRSLAKSQERFVPKQFLRALGREDIRAVEPGDHVERQLSILFSDLRGFTPLTERIGAAATIELLNRYFVSMEPAINEHGGFIDEFAGDAIMALFDNAAGAVRAGVAMFRALDRFNADSERLGQPILRMGVGVNTGPLMLGTVGGRERVKCGVVGDAVNLAARIESATKQYGARLLIADNTRVQLGGELRLRAVDRVRLFGRSAPTELFQVLEAEPERERGVLLAELDRFHDATSAYYARRFDDAAALFEACAAALPDDLVVRRYQDRCRTLRASGAPPDWDGVETLGVK